MAMDRTHLEFEFVEDESGGSFAVTAGNLTQVLSNACAAGELESAIRLYEDHGAGLGDELLAVFASLSVATRENAAKMFAGARDFARAAKMMVSCRSWPQAGAYYEQAGDFAAAAKCHQSAGDSGRAAAAFDRGGQVDLALRLYESMGAKDKIADCLARHGRPMEAAAAYRALGNVRGEVEALRLVGPADPQRPTAARQLAALYEQYGRLQEATQQLLETLRSCPAARNDAALLSQLAALFDRQSLPGQAQKAREQLAKIGGQAPSAPSAASAAAPRAAPKASGYPSQTEYAALKAIPIFAELSLEDMKDLYRVAEERQWAEGEVLFEAGVDSPGLIVLAEGSADVLAGSRVLNTLKTGAYLGEISLLQGGKTSAKVVARSPIRALAISRERFEHFLYTNETAATPIWRLFAVNLAERVRALSAGK